MKIVRYIIPILCLILVGCSDQKPQGWDKLKKECERVYQVSYDSYAGGRKTDIETLALGGNCVDQSELLCNLIKAHGIPAYVTGDTYHAWVIAELGGNKYVCNPTQYSRPVLKDSLLGEGFKSK